MFGLARKQPEPELDVVEEDEEVTGIHKTTVADLRSVREAAGDLVSQLQQFRRDALRLAATCVKELPDGG